MKSIWNKNLGQSVNKVYTTNPEPRSLKVFSQCKTNKSQTMSPSARGNAKQQYSPEPRIDQEHFKF